MTDAPSMRRRLVGSALRRYREDLGYDLAVPARILGCDRSKISRIETGQRGIRPGELRELLTEYGADPATRHALAAIARRASGQGWRTIYDPALGSAYCEFLEIENAATAIFTYAPARIPRLLQTPDYARTLISADPNIPEHARTALAAAERDRQHAALHERRTAVTAVIGEAALRQQVGSPQVTSAQLRYLAEVSGSCPHVSIRILPFAAGAHASSGAGFRVLQFSQVPSFGLVHIDGPGDGVCTDDPAAVTACTTAFRHMQQYSLTSQESAAMLGMRSPVRQA
jgi:transcriptional regulator with XRE-family HTH domain